MKSQIEKVSVQILMENVSNSSLFGQGGFSALIKLTLSNLEEKIFLFDTGGVEEAFVYNTKELETPLEKTDGIILSHGHWDHVGGLRWMANKYPNVPIYCHPDAIKPRILKLKNKKPNNIGILTAFEKEEINNVKTWTFTREPLEILPGFMISGEIPRTNSVEKLASKLLKVQIENEEGYLEPDFIKDDLSLFITLSDDSVIIITGCAHTGIVNIANYAEKRSKSDQIIGIIGGFHLIQASPEQIDFTINHLKRYPLIHLGACHCTGFVGKSRLYQSFPDTFRITAVGSQFKFPMIAETDNRL